MANLFSTPSRHGLTVYYCDNATPPSNGIAFHAAPRDADGALIDLTGYTSGSMYWQVPGTPAGSQTSVTCTLANGDATGVDVTVTPTNAAAIFENNVNSLAFGLTVGDGSDLLLAAIGTIVGSQAALPVA